MSTPQELEKQAKKCSRKFFFSFFGDSTEEAQELYNQAGNKYKVLRQCTLHPWPILLIQLKNTKIINNYYISSGLNSFFKYI